MAGGTVAVRGLSELIRDFKNLDKPTRLALRKQLRETGDVVREDASRRFSRVDSKSAAGYKTRVRQRGIAVEQSIGKTTGLHPEFGALQMRTALVPALEGNEREMERRLEHALDRINREFERRGPH